jgi:RNA polymerase sigma factor (sigma-70 family)
MDEHDRLAARFEEQRPHLRAVAYRILGSPSEADDAIQDAWLRVSRADTGGMANLGGWLTTIVARACLNLLEARRSRRGESLEARLPEPVVTRADAEDPEHMALLGDAIGPALLMVLEALAPAERAAFVLHDVFAVSFDVIAPIVGRSPAATRKLASRARHRVRDMHTAPDAARTRQREIVDAFLAAARGGDFAALLAVLDPDVVLRTDRGDRLTEVRGARAVAEGARGGARYTRSARPALVNGAVGLVAWGQDGRLLSVMGFRVARRLIVAIDLYTDPARLDRLDLGAPKDW